VNWTTILLSLTSAVTVAVLAAFLNPTFQHAVWKKQKLREQRIVIAERFAAINAGFRFSSPQEVEPNWGGILEMDGLLRLVEVLFERDETKKAGSGLRLWLDSHGMLLTGELPISQFMEMLRLRVELLARLFAEAFER
jgi:hypothetical protein